jgi:hypothetical protein
MIAGQFPSPQVFRNLQTMLGAEMPAQRLASEAAFKANDVAVLHRPLDRYSGIPR